MPDNTEEWSDDDAIEPDLAFVERVESVDDEEGDRRAQALLAGLEEYELEDDDRDVLDAYGDDDSPITYGKALPVLAVVGRPQCR